MRDSDVHPSGSGFMEGPFCGIEPAAMAEGQAMLEGDGFSLDFAYSGALFSEPAPFEPHVALEESHGSGRESLARASPVLREETPVAVSLRLGRAIRCAAASWIA